MNGVSVAVVVGGAEVGGEERSRYSKGGCCCVCACVCVSKGVS